MCPQEKLMRKYKIYTMVEADVYRVLVSNPNTYMNSYDLYSKLSIVTQRNIDAMLTSFKASKIACNQNIKGGFFVKEGFVGAAAAILEKKNSLIKRQTQYCRINKKMLTYFSI